MRWPEEETGNVMTDRYRNGLLLTVVVALLLTHRLLTPTAPAADSGNENSPPEVKTPEAMIKAIQQRATEMDKRAELLDQKEQQLRLLEKEIGQMLDRYTKLRNEIEQKKSQPGQARGEPIDRLAKMYETMAPEDAASRIERIEEPLALKILSRIKEKKAAQIISSMSPAKAARFSEKLAKAAPNP